MCPPAARWTPSRWQSCGGTRLTCEVTPHHLWFTNDTCDYRVNPPIRTADDVSALIDGIRTGVVDAIATDHAPHSEEDKLKGMAGMVGSETAFGVCYTKLCKEEGLPLELLVHLMSTRPAEILGLAKGRLEPGCDADFVLVDLDNPLHRGEGEAPLQIPQLPLRRCAVVRQGVRDHQGRRADIPSRLTPSGIACAMPPPSRREAKGPLTEGAAAQGGWGSIR